MKIEKFEDLNAWQEARGLTRDVYRISRNTPLTKDYGLKDQIQRAAVSIMSNIAEGFERTGKGERIQFMNISRASCAETKSILYVCLDNDYTDEETINGMHEQCTKISKLTTGLIRTIRDY